MIPVEQKGVLQFGSKEKIQEQVEFMHDLKKPFEMSSCVSSQSSPYFPGNYSGRNLYEQSFLYSTFSVKVEPTNAPCVSSRTGDLSFINSVESPLPTGTIIPGSQGLRHGDLSKNSLEESRLTSGGQKRPFREAENAEDVAVDTCTIDELSQRFADLPGDIFAATTSSFNLHRRHSVAASAPSSNLVLGDYACEARLEINPSHSGDQTAYTESSREDIFSLTGDFWGDHSIDACPMAGSFSRFETMNAGYSANDISYGRDLQAEGIFPNSSIGMWIDDSHSNNSGDAAMTQICKTEEYRRATKRRARPGESTKPRPKDRQLIQDHLKELRGMIPNGAKCSIDALLDRTVKRVQFLQNMTKYADRLRQATIPKLTKREKRSSCSSIDCGGATCAFVVGGQATEWPVIVDDLDTRGQMLIEMLCEDRGLFLEIADTVRGLGLVILKGEMEVQGESLWSRFVVEANRHVTRMDVFWSLVQLLRQKDPDRDLEGRVEPHMDAIDGQIGIRRGNDYKPSIQPLPIGLTEISRSSLDELSPKQDDRLSRSYSRSALC